MRDVSGHAVLVGIRLGIRAASRCECQVPARPCHEAGRSVHCRAVSASAQLKRSFKIVAGFAGSAAPMTDDPNDLRTLVFKAGQQPAAWLRSAGRLRDAAEAMIQHELPAESLYSEARKIAEVEALAQAVRNGTDFGTADIKATAPNYPPAQLLYAYAIENALKGLIVLKCPGLIQEDKLHGDLTSHDLTRLAEKAEVTVDQQQERRVLEALSDLSTWAGRYPVALRPSEYGTPNPNALLDYGSAHPIMRKFFERAYKELESGVPEQIARFEKAGVLRPA
jgi:hypothetical protein